MVTKSGTNDLRGSAFEFFRDKGLNSQTETEKQNDAPKGDYRRHQFGASLGGPIVRDRTHFFFSAERIQQDTTQSVDTRGLYPDKDGVFPLEYRENMAVAKLTHQVNANHYLTVRYGYNDNSQPYGTSPITPPESWGTSENKFHSANANLNSVLGSGKLNEFVFQFSYFHNHIGENSNLPDGDLPQRRGGGPERQHAPDHRPEEVPVPRRLHLDPRAARVQDRVLASSTSPSSTSRSTAARPPTTPTSATAARPRSRASSTTGSSARAGRTSGASRTSSTASTSRTPGG